MIDDERDHAELKRMLDAKGVVSQFITRRLMDSKQNDLSIFSNILGQMNAKCGYENYRLSLSNKIYSKNTETMVIGVNVIPLGRQSIIGLCATSNPHLTCVYSDVQYQDLIKDMFRNKNFSKEIQEQETTARRTNILQNFILEALQIYGNKNKGKCPN
jgi:hypothetical protein